MNKAMIIGNLTKDPELRKTASDLAVCTFTVAVARSFNRQEADFISVVVWRGLATQCAKYLAKGKKAAVFGRLQTRSYEDKDGNKRYVTEVVADDVEFLSPKGGETKDSSAPADKELFEGEDFEPLDDEQMPF